MTKEQLLTLKVGDELHISDSQNECQLWTIRNQLGEGAFRATFGQEPGYRATLINGNRYGLDDIHLARECSCGVNAKDNGTY